MNKFVRISTIIVLGLDSFIVPLALLGLMPTDDPAAFKVEKYWLMAAFVGLSLFGAGLWWLKRRNIKL